MTRINLANLNTAFWIARLGSFTAAAERLYTTQPAISARIRDLESSLGMKLFNRAGRGVELTIEGRDFLDQAGPLLQQLEALTASITAGRSASGTVRIGSGHISMEWIPGMLRELRDAMPDLSYELEIDLAGKLLQKLEARKLDLAIVAGPIAPDKFIGRSLGFERMLWVASPAYLDDNKDVSGREFLHKVPLWCVQRDSFYWSETMQIVLDQGANPSNFNAVSSMEAVRKLVLGGAGIGMVAQAIVREDLARGTLVVVPGLLEAERVEISIACHKDVPPSAAITAIMDAAQRHAGQLREN